LFDFGWGE